MNLNINWPGLSAYNLFNSSLWLSVVGSGVSFWHEMIGRPLANILSNSSSTFRVIFGVSLVEACVGSGEIVSVAEVLSITSIIGSGKVLVSLELHEASF